MGARIGDDCFPLSLSLCTLARVAFNFVSLSIVPNVERSVKRLLKSRASKCYHLDFSQQQVEAVYPLVFIIVEGAESFNLKSIEG